jgi:hypothetical protein
MVARARALWVRRREIRAIRERYSSGGHSRLDMGYQEVGPGAAAAARSAGAGGAPQQVLCPRHAGQAPSERNLAVLCHLRVIAIPTGAPDLTAIYLRF